MAPGGTGVPDPIVLATHRTAGRIASGLSPRPQAQAVIARAGKETDSVAAAQPFVRRSLGRSARVDRSQPRDGTITVHASLEEVTMRSRRMGLAALLATIAALLSGPAAASTGNPIDHGSQNALTVAVIGDSPYGPAQLAAFPALVDDINGDPKIDLVAHLGDVKTGSSLCSDEYFAQISSLFTTFKDPLVYTPGDNEWTDCHRPAAGGYDPLERLAKLREIFYPASGQTLGGRTKAVLTQTSDPAYAPFVENQLWMQSKVVFSAVHVVGSNNGLAPWTNETPTQQAQRLAEYQARVDAALQWLDETFAAAEENGAVGVAILMQADMWDAFSIANHLPLDGFDSIVQRLADRANAFEGPVLLLEGDSHRFLVDNPLANGDPVHHVATPVANLTRIVVEGETASEWLRLTIDPKSPQPFSWERIPV
jgi:hypothetical protein